VDSIDQNVLAVLDERRIKMMRKVPTRSTLLTHNVALNRIFDEAEYKGYMTKTQRPVLKAKGKKTERRPEFSVHEIKAIRSNFDKWIDRGRADSVPIRALLKEYIECLIDTGARAGKELLDLKWTQLEVQYSPIEHKTGEIVADEFEPEGYEVSYVDLRQVVFINIQTGKTGMRQIVGRAPTVRALRHIARANYDLTLDQLIKNGLDEYIFTYREVLSKEEKQTDQEAKLRRPTSFDKLFHTYLDEHNLATDPVTKKNRPLYCLRHTYATQALTNDRVNPHTLAKQMGTSIGMIERHYSHLIPKQAVEQLRGEQTRQLMNASGFDDERYAFDEKKEKKPRSKKRALKDNL
jgi:integrase